MKIAVDAMGGDHAPKEIVAGALEAVEKNIADIILVGRKEKIESELENLTTKIPENLTICHAPEVIEMGESPATAVRRKKENSILVAHKLVKDGKADGVVSAGSTGAQMTAALMALGRIPSILRPTIAALLPTLQGPKILLDVGANVNCKPENLVQFAYMGNIYARKILGYDTPRIGLLNIGTEEKKGNALTQATYPLLKESSLNFVGNVEPRELPEGNIEVAVCDGFVGNCLLKFGEGLVNSFLAMIKEQVYKSLLTKTAAIALKPTFKKLKKELDYEEYGGAPLLGIQGVSIICHGSSKAFAITNAIKVAVQCVENDLVGTIQSVTEHEKGRDIL